MKSSLFLDKTYVTTVSNKCSDNELEIINKIINSLDKKIIIQNYELISINDDYDTYKIEDEFKSYCLKTSLDESCESIKIEANVLQNINPAIRPEYIYHGKIKMGDNISFLLTSFENADSIYSLGRSYLIDNFDSFCHSYKFLQDSPQINRSYKDNLSSLFNDSNIETSFTQEAIDSIKNNTDYDLILSIINKARNELMTFYDESFAQKTHICHGNLNFSNIIARNGLFKFINFTKSYTSHFFMDFAELIIEFGIDIYLEQDLFKRFCLFFDIQYNQQAREMYKKCYDISIRKKAIEMIIEYLKEVYMYSSLRETKLIKLSDKFYESLGRFCEIDYIKENKEFLFKTVSEPILGELN